MGAKRAAPSQSPGPRAKGRPKKEANELKENPRAKEPKRLPTEPPPPVPPVFIPDWCLPVLGLLGVSPELPESCRAMISDVLQHSGLQKEVSGRHGYQELFLKALSESFAEILTLRQQALEAAKMGVSENELSKIKVSSKLDAAKEKANVIRADRDAKHEAIVSARKAIQTAEAAQACATDQVKNHQAEHEQTQADLETFTKLVMTKFVPLKEFSFPGRQWKLREKAVQEISGALSKAGMEESLKDALLIAFKKKPADGEKFASEAIDFTEKLVSKHMESLEAKINGFGRDAQSRAAAEIAASETLGAAKKHEDGAVDDFIAADNLLLEATTAVDTAGAEEKLLGHKAAELKASLEKAQAQMAQVKSLIDSFEAARSPAEVNTEPIASTEATAEPTALAETTSEPVALAP